MKVSPAAPAATPAPPPTPAAAQPPAAPATWPTWFGPVDALLAALAVLLAFAAASFPARNADAFRHLAAGRALSQGKGWLGDDTIGRGADNPWVNWSAGADLVGFALFKADPSGAALVAAKAAAFAAAWLLLLRLRRPGDPLLPWALLLAVGAVASGPTAALRPMALSLPLLAAVFVVALKSDWGSSCRVPLRLGILTVIWANTDALCVLAPFTLALLLVGEVLNKAVLRGADSDAGLPPPPVAGLAKALLLCTLALAANPTFLGAMAKNPAEALAQLVPAELGLGLPADAADDPDLFRSALAPLSSDFLNSPSFGLAPAGVAAGALAAISLLALVLAAGKLRATPIVLWVGFAAVALQNYRLVAFFALVAVPLAAWHLNALGRGLKLGTPGGNLLGSLSGVARIVTLTALVAGLLAAWPGWLHVVPTERGFAQRVGWGVEPDPGLVRAAGEVRRLAAASPKPAAFLALGLDAADALAWFAPEQPLPINSRLRFHRKRLPGLVAMHRTLGQRRVPTNDPPDVEAFRLAQRAFPADALILGASNRRLDAAPLFALTADAPGAGLPVWHVDGRIAVVGLGADDPARRYDPARLAFGPDVPPVPTITPTRPPPDEEPPLLELWYDRPAPPPVDADDAILALAYAQEKGREADAKLFNSVSLLSIGRAAFAGVAAVNQLAPPPPPLDPARPALQLLAVRAARRAIAAQPDRFDPYQALLLAWLNPQTPGLDDDERLLQQSTARAQMLDRLPDPERGTVQQALIAAEQGRQQAVALAQGNQFDLARAAAQKALRAAKVVLRVAPAALRGSRPPADKEPPAAGFVKELEALEDQITRELSRRSEQLDRRLAGGQVSPADRFRLTADVGLPGRAIEFFEKSKADDFGSEAVAVAMQLVTLQMRAGRLEDAATNLADLRASLEKAGPGAPGAAEITQQLTAANATLQRVVGNADAASRELVGAAGRFAPLGPAERKALPDLAPAFAFDRAAVARGLPAAVGFAGVVALGPRLEAAGALQSRIVAESDFFTTVGVLAMFSGKNAEAATRFRQALAPQGVPLAAVGAGGRAAELEGLLKLLQAGGTP